MITLNSYPQNRDKFFRLIEFSKEILDICNLLNIRPVLDGSLAVFAYTAAPAMMVNDVDLSCSEVEFSKLSKVLEEKGISHRLLEWHVLQILKDDLKIELGSMEYWYKDLPLDCVTLQIENYQIAMLSLSSLREYYRRSLEDRAKNSAENEKTKYEALRLKYEALTHVSTLGRQQS